MLEALRIKMLMTSVLQQKCRPFLVQESIPRWRPLLRYQQLLLPFVALSLLLNLMIYMEMYLMSNTLLSNVSMCLSPLLQTSHLHQFVEGSLVSLIRHADMYPMLLAPGQWGAWGSGAGAAWRIGAPFTLCGQTMRYLHYGLTDGSVPPPEEGPKYFKQPQGCASAKIKALRSPERLQQNGCQGSSTSYFHPACPLADTIFVQNFTPPIFQAKRLHRKSAYFAIFFNHDLSA